MSPASQRRTPSLRRQSDELPTLTVTPADSAAMLKMLAEDTITLAFQPQISVATGRVVGVEALARDPEGANPESLFAAAATAGLAERLSRAIQRKALRAAAEWKEPLSSLRLSLNLLPQDLARPGYERWLLEEIRLAGLQPQSITAEITESSLIADPVAAAARLACLRAAGVRIAVDDFGTGYASLAYLVTLPLDMIKIDRGLIHNLVGGRRAQIVVKALIALARELELQVLVEGVEDPAQLALLKEWGCDQYQGFLGAKAMTEEELTLFLA